VDRTRILVLDDDLFMRRILYDIFHTDYDIKCLPTIKEFKDALYDFMPDLTLIDVNLPDGNGIDLIPEIRKHPKLKNIFILVLTASEDISSIERAYTSGANDYIRKPFIPFEISSKISLIAQSINYQKTIYSLYENQKSFNNKLFKLASIINSNIQISTRYGILSSMFQIATFVETSYIEVVFFDYDGNRITNKNTVKSGFKGIEYDKIKGKSGLFDKEKGRQSLRIRNSSQETVYCLISPILYNWVHSGYLIMQNDIPYTKEAIELLGVYLDFVNIKGTDINTQEQLRDEVKKDRMEIAKVRTLQVQLLPDFEEIDKFDIASSFIPMEDISGDFFDGFYISENIYQIIVCDVAGHGVASSYIGSSIRGMLRSASKEMSSVKELVDYVNQSVVKSMKDTYYFSSIVICQLNIENGNIEIVSAGHPSSLYYNSGKEHIEQIPNTGPLLGLDADSVYKSIKMSLHEGDSLFLYTDGLTEAIEPNKRIMFGENRLSQSLQECAKETAIDIVHSVIGKVYEHTEYSSFQDDVSVICIKRR
jgi:CheY-like chemotaxis protein